MDDTVTEGVVLRATPFKEYDQIASLFTLQEGKLQIITSRACKKNVSPLNPLMRVEVQLKSASGTLYRANHYNLLDSYLSLRQQYTLLTNGCMLLKAIDLSQQGQKAAPKLYQLLMFYLTKLPELTQSDVGVSSFYLKVLRHEGLFDLSVFDGMSQEEKTIITFFAHVLDWQALVPLVLPGSLHEAIARVFHAHF